MNEKIKIIIADDNIFFCELLKKYLNELKFIDVVGTANNDSQEIFLIKALKPDIVITDIIKHEKFTGIDVIKLFKMKKNSPKFLLISGFCNEKIVRKAINEGLIDGHLSKLTIDLEKIVEEVKRISKL